MGARQKHTDGTQQAHRGAREPNQTAPQMPLAILSEIDTMKLDAQAYTHTHAFRTKKQTSVQSRPERVKAFGKQVKQASSQQQQ